MNLKRLKLRKTSLSSTTFTCGPKQGALSCRQIENLEQLHTLICMQVSVQFLLARVGGDEFLQAAYEVVRGDCWIVAGNAAKMVDGHQDMEGWGVYSIFKESGRLLYQHFRIIRPFILAFLLPLALILFLEVIGIAWFLTWVADHAQPHHMGGIVGHHRHSGLHAFHATCFKAPNPPDPVPVFVLQLLLLAYTLIFLITIISWLLVSLTTAAIAKAIHHIYSNNNNNPTSHNEDGNSSQTQVLTHSIFASLPHSLYRIFIISLCFFIVDILTYFLVALPFYFLSGPKFEPYHLQTIHTWLWYLVSLFLHFWFLVSVQVVVLESYDGWAALQRSAKLVKAKVWTSLVLVGVYFVYFCVFDLVLAVTILIPAHSVILYVTAVALALGYLAVEAFWFVVVTVFYFVSLRKCGGGGEEGRHPYQALDVSVEN